MADPEERFSRLTTNLDVGLSDLGICRDISCSAVQITASGEESESP